MVRKFADYIADVYSQLECNMSDLDKQSYICYTYTEAEINKHLAYFKKCQKEELSAYKALLFLCDYLADKTKSQLMRLGRK